MKEIDPNNVMIFQNGKLMALGTIIKYSESGDEWRTDVLVTKGTLLTGEQEMEVCCEYEVTENSSKLN